MLEGFAHIWGIRAIVVEKNIVCRVESASTDYSEINFHFTGADVVITVDTHVPTTLKDSSPGKHRLLLFSQLLLQTNIMVSFFFSIFRVSVPL